MSDTIHRLVLDVSYADGELRASVSASGPRRAPVQTWASRPVSLDVVRSLHAQITSVLNRANRWGDMDQGSRDLLRQRGQLLFDEVLPASIKRLLRELGGGELTLILDEALVFIPWELMHTGAGFVCLDWAIGRVVRTPRAVIGGARPEPAGPWRMLVLCDPRGDLMGSYYEGITLRDELDAARPGLAVDLRSSEVGVGDVKGLVREYDLIHYAGHAEIHPDRPADSGWLLSDGVLSPSALLDLAGGPSFPRLVFSNACRSGQVDGPLVVDAYGEAIYSLANAFLLSGVHHYVGTLWDIPDEPACQFSLAFYEAVAEGAPLGEALRRSRHALAERYGADTVLWASYVLYGDPSAPCFAAPEAPAPRAEPQPAPVDLAAPPRPGPMRPRLSPPRVRGHARSRAWPGGDALADATDAARARLRTVLPWLLAFLLLPAAFAIAEALAGAGDDPVVSEGPYILERGPVAYPAPRDPAVFDAPLGADAAHPAAPAAVPVAATPAGPELIVVAQRADAAGEFHEAALEEGGTLHSWDNFQLRFRLAAPGHVAIWHVESKGAIRRIHPEGDSASAHVDHVGWVELPSADTWYYLDDRRGLERFVLGFSADSPPAEDDVVEALAPHSGALEALRQPEADDTDEGLTLRGLGGTRPATRPRSRAAEADLLEAIEGVFEAHYDDVRVVEFRHR